MKYKIIITISLAITLSVCGLTGCKNQDSKKNASTSAEAEFAAPFSPEDYRFPREVGTTKGGYPVT